MKKVTIEYGDSYMDIEVPEHAVVVREGEAFTEPPAGGDPWELTRRALENPLGMPRIRELVGLGSKVVIGFPDRVKGGFHETSHRRVSIPLVLEELKAAGVDERDIKLVCGIGLHRKNLREEFEAYLGREIVDRFWGERLVNHDSEDPESTVKVGETDEGDECWFNRYALEADLTILIGHASGNPYGGYSGGYKMPCTGFTSWRSIRAHHSPRSLYAQDFLPINTRSHFRCQLHKIGKLAESAMKRPIFALDAVLNGRAEQMAVYAGAVSEVEKAAWPKAGERTEITLNTEAFDVLVIGMPRNFHYGPGMGSNPILLKQAIGSSVARAFGALKPDAVSITASICDGWFNDEWFPAYREVYDRLQRCHTPGEMVRYEEDLATKPEYIRLYRHAYAYHPFHAFSMTYFGGIADRVCKANYLVGAKEPGFARGMGLITKASFAEALRDAERHVGKNPRILIVPALSKSQVHVGVAGR